MSHYKPYPAYKDSGVEWLGKVPEHWNVLPLKYLLKTMSGGQATKNTVSAEPLDGHYPAFSASGQDVWMPEFDFDTSGIVLSAVGARCGKTFKADGKWGVVANTHCLFPRLEADRDYFWYITNREEWWEKGGTAQPFVKVSATLDRKHCFPPKDEQVQIARALDLETARIDALINKKTRFIELLHEKRQTLITHAVTKGLDPSVKMKYSGVEWLGEVPEHWSIRPLKQLARLDGGAGFPDDEQGNKDAPIPFFKVADLANGLTTAENYITPEAAERLRAKIFPAGTIAFAKVGAALLLNRRVLMPLPGCADNNMMVALPHGVSGEWLSSVLSCFDMAWLVNPGAVPSVNQEQVGNIKIPVPSAEEQASIVAGVRSGVTRIDALVGKTERSIELLKERRSALITAAVTGQIDLRETA